MADSDGSPQRDDRHHRRSRSRSPASPEWTGETLAEREERRLAEAAVLVGPPPPAREPEPAEVTAPAAQAASPAACKVFVQPIFSLFSVQNLDICTPTENHDPSSVLDSVGISGSGISVVLHSWCFHHFLYNKTEFGSATASPEIARADPEIVDF